MTRNPSICFVQIAYTKYLVGGAEVQTWLLAKELVRRGWEVHITTEDFGQLTPSVVIDDGITIHKLKRRVHFKILTGYQEVYHTLNAIDADIYFHMGSYIYHSIAARVANKKCKKYIWASGSDMGGCKRGSFIKREMYHRQSRIHYVGLLIEALLNEKMHAYGILHADKIVAQTEKQRLSIAMDYCRDSIVFHATGHPVPQHVPQKTNPISVSWVASLKTLKQPEEFLRLADKCNDLDCLFVMAGRTAEKWTYNNELMKQIASLTNLNYLGEISFDESNVLIGLSSIFVNTSLYEGIPNTFIQAWMRETPTVSLAVDPDDMIETHGLGMHSKSIEQLIEDVRFLVEHKQARQECGKRAREFAMQEFDINKVVDQWITIFQG